MGFSKTSPDNRVVDSAPASASASEDPSSSSSSNLSFLSRFALPFRSRTRYIADFHIRPAEPHRKYGAGDQVQGAVVLTVVKPVRITHLVVSLYGYIRVYKGPNVPTKEPILDPADVPSALGRSSRQKGSGNRWVSLFQDEQTLSGDGRLEPGRYEFNFNLLFPPDGLPSSIDFERGTISYMITATLTRPASIGTKTPPKTSCERKVYLTEKIDIGLLSPPRSRTIYLEPISRRPRRKRPPIPGSEKSSIAIETTAPASDPDPTRANENSTEGSWSVAGEDPEHDPAGNNARSPVQSDVRSVSSDSAVSGSGSTGQSKHGDGTLAVPSTPSLAGKRASIVKERTITSTVELLKGGCLPGDMIPIKISVQHIRRMKSMHGVIVTLYRLGRIDSSPPLLSNELPEAEARRLEKEEYYPKSKTGLGGLSLSSAGSCSVFRKDLSQAFAPLIIDPDNLTANLTTSVRVPEDVFPTIGGVPYGMISFKYYIEVIVDLGGRLSNQIQGGKPSGTRLSPVTGPLGMTGTPFDAPPLTSWGTSIIDTDRLRRQKGVICVVFEVVVGTTDSSRLRGKEPMKPDASVQTVPVRETEAYEGGSSEKQPRTNTVDDDSSHMPNEYTHDYAPSSHPPPPRASQPYPYWDRAPPRPPSAPHYIPPPDVPDETALTEKERIRRAEQRLLPSQPPEAPVAGSSSLPLASGDNIYDADDQMPAIPVTLSRDHEKLHPNPPDLDAPSAPTLEDLSPGGETHAMEDKQELERQRLLAEASTPPECPEDYDNGASRSSAAAPPQPPPASPGGPSAPPMVEFEPSAPVLEDEDAYGPHYAYGTAVAESSTAQALPSGGAGPAEPLPRYER